MKLHRIIKGNEPKAEVIEFTSGIVAIGWLMEPFQVTIWTNLDHAIEAHSLDRTMTFEPWDRKEIANGRDGTDAQGKKGQLARRPRKTRRSPGENAPGP